VHVGHCSDKGVGSQQPSGEERGVDVIAGRMQVPRTFQLSC
jgi:hypothetical protein